MKKPKAAKQSVAKKNLLTIQYCRREVRAMAAMQMRFEARLDEMMASQRHSFRKQDEQLTGIFMVAHNFHDLIKERTGKEASELLRLISHRVVGELLLHMTKTS